ncbi:MAG: SDR family oxidoreductase, partial [Flavobacteriaceae bacterium]|nr:SDR family oxidoreductase [Flavobacteriaceae bacterium]
RQLRKINIDGTANIVNLSIINQVKKLCYVSSIAAVGQTETNETINENTEWNKENHHSVYAITKYGAEMEVWRGTQEGLDVVIVNPGIIIGPGFWRSGSGSLFKRIYKGLSHYTTGTTGYVDVNDVTKIMLKLMQSTIKNERYIVVAENLTYQRFFNITAKCLNVKPPEKEASPLLLQIAWRLDWLNSKLRGKRRRLVKHTVTSLQNQSKYDNSKVVKALEYEFMGLDFSIEQTSQLFSSEFQV